MSLLRKMITGVAALAAGAVAACDDAPTSRVAYMRPGGVADLLRSATSRGPLLVETLSGGMAGFDAHVTGQIVAEAVKSGIHGRVITVTTDPAPAGDPTYRLRVALDVPSGMNPKSLCVAESTDTVGGGEKLNVLMVFCSQGEMEAAVRGHIPRPEAPTDAKFGTLISQMTRDLFAEKPIGG